MTLSRSNDGDDAPDVVDPPPNRLIMMDSSVQRIEPIAALIDPTDPTENAYDTIGISRKLNESGLDGFNHTINESGLDG